MTAAPAHEWFQVKGLIAARPTTHVRFSNRPFGVKHCQTIHHYSVDVAHGLVLLFGIGTSGPRMGLFESSRVTHFFHRRVLGSISPGLILTASSTMMQSG